MLLNLNDKLPFGKHKGETIKEVIKKDAQYLYWACENIPQFALTTKVQEKLPDKNKSVAYLKAKKACSDMRGFERMLNSGPSGEYAQLALDSEPFDFDEENES